MFAVKLFPAQARLLIVGRSFWDVPEAERFYEDVRVALLRWGPSRPLRIYADLTEHELQDSGVSEVNARTAALLRAAPIDHYALMIPHALLRLQARRLLEGVDYRIFGSQAEAAGWLDWPIEDLTREVEATREPVPVH